MKKRLTVAIFIMLLCLLAALPAMAADVFKYSDQSANVYAGETIRPVLLQDGKFTEGTVVYTASGKACTVDETGTITGVTPGQVSVTASLQQDGKTVKTAKIVVNVARKVTKVTLNTTNLKVYEPDDEAVLAMLRPRGEDEEPLQDRVLFMLAKAHFYPKVAVTPDDVTARDKGVVYESSDVGVVKFYDNQICAIQPGECDLIIRSKQNPDVYEKFHVLVAQPVTKIEVTAPLKTVPIGENMQLEPVITPDDATVQAVTWSSRNPKLATVDENGVVTGVAQGNVYIDVKATDGSNKTAAFYLTVVQSVEQITLQETEVSVFTGQRAQLHATVLPKTATNRNVTWASSDESVATVQNGVVTGHRIGQCVVTCASVTNPDVTASVLVQVTQPVTQIQITAPLKTVPVGESMQLNAAVSPADATVQDVVWSSRNPKIATVDEYGTVTGITQGSVNIDAKATDGSNKTASFYLTVVQSVEEITLQETSASVFTGQRVQLHATVLPKNATNRNLTWTSSDESVATVQNGSVTGRSVGTCVITCASVTNPDVTASVTVQVNQKVTDITFVTPAGLSIYVGESRELEWKVLPEDATNKAVTFKSRNEKVAVVDQNGIVTGRAKGQADIEVKAADGSGKYRVYRVTVLKAVEGIEPLAYQYYAPLGRSITISASVYPKDASNQKITYYGGDDYIASVSNTGTRSARVTGRRRGSFTLTATTEDGGFTASTNVVVDDFDGLVSINSATIDNNNKIRLLFYNMSRDFALRAVYFKVKCYDTQGNPMPCTTEGDTVFTGTYPLTIEPYGKTEHGRFKFHKYQVDQNLGYVEVTITGYDFENGQRWEIPEEQQFPYRSSYSSHMWEPTPTPLPTAVPTFAAPELPAEGGDAEGNG